MLIIILLFLTGTSGQLFTPGGLYPPPYIQARNAFEHAKIFLQANLPHETRDFSNPEARKHFSFGSMVGVTGALVKAFDSVTTEYKPLEVLHDSLPQTWENYNKISQEVNNLLSEANAKIKPITSVIGTLCDMTNSVEACNLEVHEHIINHRFLKQRARFLLQVGRAAKILNRHAHLLEDVAAKNKAVLYLSKLVDTTAFEVFIAELTRAYELMRPKVAPLRNNSHF